MPMNEEMEMLEATLAKLQQKVKEKKQASMTMSQSLEDKMEKAEALAVSTGIPRSEEVGEKLGKAGAVIVNITVEAIKGSKKSTAGFLHGIKSGFLRGLNK